MRLYEFEAASFFRQEGIPVPDFEIAESPTAARKAAGKIGGSVVIKAQVLTGGRGLAGGVKTADSPEQAEEIVWEWVAQLTPIYMNGAQ